MLAPVILAPDTFTRIQETCPLRAGATRVKVAVVKLAHRTTSNRFNNKRASAKYFARAKIIEHATGTLRKADFIKSFNAHNEAAISAVIK